MARFSDLPEEVVVEILSWLPAESLMRFKCVRKSWYALIKNPKFVSKHLANQIQSSSINNNNNIGIGRNLCIFFLRNVLSNAGKKEIVLSLVSYDYKTEPTLTNGDDVSVTVKNMSSPHPHIDMVGNCNGIICLACEVFILVNPEIREFRFLPESCIPTPPPRSGTHVGRLRDGMGFGYDPKTDNYKVVNIWDFREDNFYLNSVAVEVYTLRTDSWREIKNDVVKEARICVTTDSFQRCFNGVFYWWAKDYNIGKDMILAFDLSDEVFQKIPMPDLFGYASLVELNESLALIDQIQPNDPMDLLERKFYIWVMDEFGLNGTWSKILTIGPLEGIATPLVFWKSDELLMRDVYGRLVSYNLSTKEIKDHLPAHDFTEIISAEIYVRSLLSVKGGNELA